MRLAAAGHGVLEAVAAVRQTRKQTGQDRTMHLVVLQAIGLASFDAVGSGNIRETGSDRAWDYGPILIFFPKPF